ncbi:MAG: dTDP-4-dehydrorhamnose reductase [Chloroflexota bacterium]|jgi:dTDP-4-dehydrorhamnose reductase
MIEPAARDTVISGCNGRLGRALTATAPTPVGGWARPELDLDDPEGCAELVRRDRPRLLIHAAAMTAVDQAADEPEVALRRNGTAVGAMAHACRETGTRFVLISTNEVFDGERTDGRGYLEDDPVAPPNPYGASKRAGEVAALEAFGDAAGLWIVRTAWLYGPPGGDFPDKITAAADRVHGPLSVVSDEIGSPTYALDLARAIHELVDRTYGGVYHLANAGSASRLDWARAVLAVRRPGRELRPIMLAEYERPSDPPRWGVLDTSRAAAAGVVMRSWSDALADYLSTATGSEQP